MPELRYNWIPEAAWPYLGAALAGIDADLSALATGGAAALPGQAAISVQTTPDGGTTWTWSLTPAQAAAVHAADGVIEWISPTNGPTPTTLDGFAPGDIVNGVLSVIVNIPPEAAPSAQNLDGTALDTVTLTKTLGVTWTVAGVDHKSSDMVGATKVVPYTAGVNTTVTAKPETGYLIGSGSTTSWPLTFTAAYADAYTSESFTRTAGALAAGTPAITTDAAWGGTGTAMNLNFAAAIEAAGWLRFTAANTAFYSAQVTPVPQSRSVTATIQQLSTYGSGSTTITVARQADGAKQLKVNIATAGVWLEVQGIAGAPTDTVGGGALAIGNVIRLDAHRDATADAVTGALTASAGNCCVCVYVNGVFRKRLNVTTQFPFDTFALGQANGSTSFGGFDDMIVQQPAVVHL